MRVLTLRYNTYLFSGLFIAALSSFTNVIAQESILPENKFSISGQLRPRFEWRAGTFRPLKAGEKPAALISERIRLTMNYTHQDVLSVRISPQSVSIWGQANLVQGAENSGNRFSLFEAWARLKLSHDWSVMIGRQVISLDDERFFGELDWAQGGRAHDALSIHFNKNTFEAKGFFAYNQNYKSLYANNLNNPSGNLYNSLDAFPHKWMQTVWVGLPLGKKSRLTFLATNLGFQNAEPNTIDTTVYYSQTFGTNISHTGEKFNGNISAYYQGGKNNLGTKTRAYLLAGYAGYKVHDLWSLGVGSDWVSGNNVGKPLEVNRTFNPYFHTGHKFYGAMDYYFVGNSHKNAGLSDNYLKATYKPKNAWSFTMALHQFFTPNTVWNDVKRYETDLGQEIDLVFSRSVNKFTNITGGYSAYWITPTVNYLKNTAGSHRLQQWAWLSLNVTPTFFETKFQTQKL